MQQVLSEKEKDIRSAKEKKTTKKDHINAWLQGIKLANNFNAIRESTLTLEIRKTSYAFSKISVLIIIIIIITRWTK